MNWRQVAAHVLALAALEVLREVFGIEVWIGLLIGTPIASYLIVRMVREQRRGRIRDVARLAPEAREAALSEMSEDERAAARIKLGMASMGDTAGTNEGEVFRYPRTPWLLREGTFWVSAIGAAIAFATIVLNWNRSAFAWVLGLFLTANVGYQARLWDTDLATVRLSAEGIEEVAGDGTRTLIRWNEVAGVRYRRWIACLDIVAQGEARTIRVRYNLEGFPRFAERLVAFLKNRLSS